jgi:hypothetical protein
MTYGRRLAWWAPGALLALGLAGCKNISGGQAGAGEVGAACQAEGECDRVEGTPVCLKMPAGYCSTTCEGSGFFDCDSQSICEQLGDRAYFCMDGCLTANGNDDCRGDYRCAARPDVSNLDGSEVGVCLPRCESDADCETGRRCDRDSGNCIARGDRATGEACSSNGPCNGGLCITSPTFRGGYCSARCGSQFEGCEPGSQCVELDGAQAVCLSTCDGDGDCRGSEGYKCRQIGVRKDPNGNDVPNRVCVPRCQSNDECADGQHCDVDSGDCTDGAGEPNPLGQFCADDGECASGRCVTDDGWLLGYCTSGCDGGCGDGVCGQTTAGEICLSACQGDLDCRPGYVCGETANGKGCTAPCTADGDCAEGLRCIASSGRCAAPSEGDAEIVETALGRVSVSGSPSDPVTLTVPEGAQSVAILAESGQSDLMIIAQMTDPTGRVIYDFQDPFGSEARFFPSDDVTTQYLPSSPRSAPTPGDYTFQLIKEGGRTDVSVRALFKVTDGVPETAGLDVNFFFAEIPGLDAASAESDADFQAALRVFRDIYASAGVTLGDIRYCQLRDADAKRYAVIDDTEGTGSELSRMFALSGEAEALGCKGEQALNFFLVEEIVGGRAGYIILGIAGGIPGPPIGGTTHSGVAVTMTGYSRNPKQIGQTMAHEGGHFLGLFHTTEADGNAFDPLRDTPECGSGRDRNGDGVVAYDECLSDGARNLMFWAAGDEAEQLSGDQGFVVIRNPGLR